MLWPVWASSTSRSGRRCVQSNRLSSEPGSASSELLPIRPRFPWSEHLPQGFWARVFVLHCPCTEQLAPPPSRSERDVQNAPLKLSQFVEGRSWCTCERGGINEPRLFAYDWLENSEEIHSFSASVDAL